MRLFRDARDMPDWIEDDPPLSRHRTKWKLTYCWLVLWPAQLIAAATFGDMTVAQAILTGTALGIVGLCVTIPADVCRIRRLSRGLSLSLRSSDFPAEPSSPLLLTRPHPEP
jgi:hypothetical protein